MLTFREQTGYHGASPQPDREGDPVKAPADVHLIKGDLTPELFEAYAKSAYLCADTETTGLNPHRDRLCLIQLCNEDGLTTVLQVSSYDMPLLVKLLEAERPLKLFHFARFDLAMLRHHLGAKITHVYCTKVASKIARTFSGKHGLKDLTKDLLGVELDKSVQTSYWGADDLSPAQLAYSANDVRYLIPLKEKLDAMLVREGRMDLALACMQHLPTLIQLDLQGWENLFEH
ncbi:ribonuclease D [bacterium]|nr:ribonuclease D [bacterium]